MRHASSRGITGADGSLETVTTPPFPPVSETDLTVLRAQLGRPARGVVGIAARCVCGNPTVAATAPRLEDGTPFPTFYYLTHPAATAAMSGLEATQVMRTLSDELADEPEVARGVRAARMRRTCTIVRRSAWSRRSTASRPAGCRPA